ncbi:MAG: acetate--CoA ligase [Dissulfuribacterales bacterium]
MRKDFDSQIEALTRIKERFAPPQRVRDNAYIKDYDSVYAYSIRDPEGFWGQIASELEWFAPWDRVREFNLPEHKWFLNGKTNITLNALDRHANSWRRNKVAIIWLSEDGKEEVATYGQLRDRVNQFANGLKSKGIKKGDRVIIYMPLVIEGVIAMLACARIGAIHSVVYAGMGAGSLRSRVEDSRARAVICADIGYRRGKVVRLKETVDEAIKDLDMVETVIVFRRQTPQIELNEWEEDFWELLRANSHRCEPEVMDSEDPLFILYTSGTTGRPKGVVHVHGGFMVGTYYLTKAFFDVKDVDVYWSTSDIGWIVGHSYIVYGPLCAGATVLIREGSPDYPHPGIVWEKVQKYGVSVMFTAPTAIRMFMRFGKEHIEKFDRSTLRVLACAGEPLNPEAWRFAQEVILENNGHCVDNFWQTEVASPILGTLPAMFNKPGRVGKPMPGVVADVVDENGASVPAGQGGYLVLRQPLPYMMRTIYGNPDLYREVWSKFPGCYQTGDIAVCDEDGYFSVLGRSDDVLNVAGHRIGTADVENALVGHPSVAEAAAIGIPDEIKGEVIKVFVVLRAGKEASEGLRKSIIQHVRMELGPIATPQEVEFVAKLPKTRSGKIMRRLLKAEELGLEKGDTSTLED